MSPATTREKLPLLSIYLPSLLLFIGQSMLIPILPLYAKTFQAGYALIGIILAARGIGIIVGDIPSGLIISRIGAKPAMLAGLVIVTIFSTAPAWAQSIPELIVYRFLAGLGSSFWQLARHSYLTHTTRMSRRGRTLSIFGGTVRLGGLLGPFAGGYAVRLVGYRPSFVIVGGLAVIAMIITGIFVGEKRIGAVKSSERLGLAVVFKSNLATLAGAGSAVIFATMIRTSRSIIVPLYAADIVGLEVESVGLILTILSLADLSVFYFSGLLMDRFGRKFAIVPCFAVQAVGMFLIPFTTTFPGLLAAVCVLGLGNGLGAGTMMTLGADLAAGNSPSEFLSIWRVISDTGVMGGPLLMGAIAGALGLSASPLAAAACGLIAAAVFLFGVPETHRPRRRKSEN